MEENLRQFLSDPRVLVGWGVLVLLSLGWFIADVRRQNRQIMSVMRMVWFLTVLYSGPLGLLLYFYAGRKQIARDDVWRRGVRSVAHCYSGCGLGEIAGVFIAAGLFSLPTFWVAVITFSLAYVAGYLMTMFPLLQEGEPWKDALWDAFLSDTATITVMEIVAVFTDIWLSMGTDMAQPLFWSSLIVSLTLGLVAAYPVNVLLVRYGIKKGMHDPREMGHAALH